MADRNGRIPTDTPNLEAIKQQATADCTYHGSKLGKVGDDAVIGMGVGLAGGMAVGAVVLGPPLGAGIGATVGVPVGVVVGAAVGVVDGPILGHKSSDGVDQKCVEQKVVKAVLGAQPQF